MQWPDINNIILPLFLSATDPVVIQRDNTLKIAQDHVIAYCKDLPLGKHPDSSYLCRLQIENDCIDSQKKNACDLLVKLRELENKSRGHQIAIIKNKKPEEEKFWCRVADPILVPDRFPAFDYKQELQELEKKVAAAKLPGACETDSDCRVIGVGVKACGGHREALYYSVQGKEPAIIKDIQKMNSFEDRLNRETGRISDCSLAPLYPPICHESICTGKPGF